MAHDKRIVIIQGSARDDGDTARICEIIGRRYGSSVIHLCDASINAYTYDHRYQDDDFLPTMDQLLQHDIVILATPIYWYSMSGHLKNFLDRWTDLLQVYKQRGRQLSGKKMLVLSCGHVDHPPPHFFTPFALTADYLGMAYLGDLHINHPSFAESRYQSDCCASIDLLLGSVV